MSGVQFDDLINMCTVKWLLQSKLTYPSSHAAIIFFFLFIFFFLCVWWEHLKSTSKFPGFNIVLLTIVKMLCIRFLDLLTLHNFNAVPLDQYLPISPASLPVVARQRKKKTSWSHVYMESKKVEYMETESWPQSSKSAFPKVVLWFKRVLHRKLNYMVKWLCEMPI